MENQDQKQAHDFAELLRSEGERILQQADRMLRIDPLTPTWASAPSVNPSWTVGDYVGDAVQQANVLEEFIRWASKRQQFALLAQSLETTLEQLYKSAGTADESARDEVEEYCRKVYFAAKKAQGTKAERDYMDIPRPQEAFRVRSYFIKSLELHAKELISCADMLSGNTEFSSSVGKRSDAGQVIHPLDSPDDIPGFIDSIKDIDERDNYYMVVIQTVMNAQKEKAEKDKKKIRKKGYRDFLRLFLWGDNEKSLIYLKRFQERISRKDKIKITTLCKNKDIALKIEQLARELYFHE